jgi:predicted DNA-binding protein
MKAISVHVAEQTYEALRAFARREGRTIAEVIREALIDYLAQQRAAGKSVLEIAPHASGRLRRGWTRSDLLDEMRSR